MRGKQCRWASEHGGDGFLLCGLDEGHDGQHLDVYQVGMVVHASASGAAIPTWPADHREWFPEWLWRSVVEQDRERIRGTRTFRYAL